MLQNINNLTAFEKEGEKAYYWKWQFQVTKDKRTKTWILTIRALLFIGWCEREMNPDKLLAELVTET